MKRKRQNLDYLFFILPLFLILFLFIFYFLKFKTVVFENENFYHFLNNYFQNQSLLKIIFNFRKIMTDFPEIIKIEIYPNFFKQNLRVKIESSKIVAKICDSQNCYFLDNYSRIIYPKILPKNVPLKIQSYLDLKKDSLLNPKLTQLLSLIFEYANWKPLILKEIKIYSNLDLGVFDNKNREFLFDPNRDFEEQIKKLHLFLVKNFEASRIDLRIPKKIYYK